MSHPIHPLIVHFPIALLFTSVFFDVLGMLVNNRNFRQTGLWLLVLGLIGGIVASIFGAWSEEVVEAMGVPEAAIERHEHFAIASLVVFGALLAFRWWIRGTWSARQKAIYFSVAMAGLLLLGTTGFFGGELVYRYGAGVSSPALPPGPPPSPHADD
jgi:uncharacterized membrane protein